MRIEELNRAVGMGAAFDVIIEEMNLRHVLM